MYANFDRSSPLKLDSTIQSLSWKGTGQYGWLAVGNTANTVGVTFTQLNSACEPPEDGAVDEQLSLSKQGMRRNFNFREHSHEVTIVRWNPILDKIATCDSSGTVIVWRNHNGRSVMELVNNRGSQISDFQWSNDGSKVLITYIDGYVLVGTAFGRRIWARQLNIGSFVTTPSNHTQPSHLLSSTWSPDDSRIVVGSSIGELIELDAFSNGSLVSTTEVLPGIGIIGLQWVRVPGAAETEKPKPLSSSRILEGENEEKQNVRLSLYLRNGKVVLMNSCGDQQATIIRTGLMDGKMSWSQDGSVLAVSGLRKSQGISTVRFFQPSGQLLFTLPLNTKDPVTALAWAHDNTKLFIATTSILHTVNVTKSIPTLQDLAKTIIAGSLINKESSFDLTLPTRFKFGLAETFSSIVKGHVPKDNKLLEYVSRPPPSSNRIYCTLIPSNSSPNSSSSSNSHRTCRHPSQYTLYVEHLGTLIPILEATRRSSKIRPSFTISLPSSFTASDTLPQTPRGSLPSDSHPQDSSLELGESTNERGGGSTHPPLRCGGNGDNPDTHNSLNTESGGIQLACKEDERESGETPRTISSSTNSDSGTLPQDSLASSRHLAEVSSHIIASKFRIQTLHPSLPSDQGTITIKTSFLHIQPRKVIVNLPFSTEEDSGIDSESEDSLPLSSIESRFSLSYGEGDLSLDSLSSLEELPGTSPPSASTPATSTLRHAPSEGHTARTGTLPTCNNSTNTMTSSTSDNPVIIHSKTPTWNEQHMIYQLDFGGRVTTKSAKNFQLEMGSDQVLQFGRIENGSFILDFQAPFTPIQAFATALANLV